MNASVSNTASPTRIQACRIAGVMLHNPRWISRRSIGSALLRLAKGTQLLRTLIPSAVDG